MTMIFSSARRIVEVLAVSMSVRTLLPPSQKVMISSFSGWLWPMTW